jgi:ABC-type nickel/cobalt efflux system permease component RcnA
MWSDILFALVVAVGVWFVWLACWQEQNTFDEDETEANAMTPGRYDDAK